MFTETVSRVKHVSPSTHIFSNENRRSFWHFHMTGVRTKRRRKGSYEILQTIECVCFKENNIFSWVLAKDAYTLPNFNLGIYFFCSFFLRVSYIRRVMACSFIWPSYGCLWYCKCSLYVHWLKIIRTDNFDFSSFIAIIDFQC